MTQLELELIASLRRKIGDLPTRIITADDVGHTVYIEGVPSIATTSDINKVTWDSSKQIWSDSELLSELYDSFYILFNNKGSLEDLTEIEKRILILSARIELILQLATDAARYIKYTAQSINVEPVSPAEFINLAKALSETLDQLKDEYYNSDLNTIQSAIIKFHDRFSGLSYPTDYSPTPKLPGFEVSLSSVPLQVEINIKYKFVVDFNYILLKKYVDNVSTILEEYTVLKDATYIDTDILSGKTYKYELILITRNNEQYSTFKNITVP